ncbi:hypothetical protein BsIDN1_68710 [Bacillus safensis]|uniref:Uncharacterized protein n=1 Tax=Bacillus safensis TaxID=561879 RepID=A0A5S9MJJ8_BACIA|nr:hypothetical protein BsIDN1_68710 [Bacillus safensis]
MKVIYDKNNTPDVESMLFVIPGENQSWLVSGIKKKINFALRRLIETGYVLYSNGEKENDT